MILDVKRQFGVHYTDKENILKVIKPLFLDELYEEYAKAEGNPLKLIDLQNKISSLKFLDPASGCGNFLIVTYTQLIELENKVIKDLEANGVETEFKVNPGQFYGIEINPDACDQTEKLFEEAYKNLDNLIQDLSNKEKPVKKPSIINANALRIDWETVIPKTELNYIIGNPPFIGSSMRNKSQKEDMDIVFDKSFKNYGMLDYVAAWFKKAADYMKDTKIETAFVSTNSIAQGTQPSFLWEPLFKNYGCEINFAYRSFKW